MNRVRRGLVLPQRRLPRTGISSQTQAAIRPLSERDVRSHHVGRCLTEVVNHLYGSLSTLLVLSPLRPFDSNTCCLLFVHGLSFVT